MTKRTIKQLILGSLMGDLNMHYATKKSNYPRIGVNHSIKQKEYVMLKYEILKEYVLTPPKEKYRAKSFGKYSIGFQTQSLPIFVKYYSLCYPGGKKTFTMEWLNQLTEEGLAYWHMDDGSIMGLKKRFKISSYSSTLEEHKIIQQYFKERWGIDMHIALCNVTKYYHIELNAKNRNKFINLIRPYLIPSMEYKARTSEIVKCCKICGKEFITNISFYSICSKECRKINQYRLKAASSKRIAQTVEGRKQNSKRQLLFLSRKKAKQKSLI